MGCQVSSAAGSPELLLLKSGSPTKLQDWSGSEWLARCVLLEPEAAESVIRKNQIKGVPGQDAVNVRAAGPGTTWGTEIHSVLCCFH